MIGLQLLNKAASGLLLAAVWAPLSFARRCMRPFLVPFLVLVLPHPLLVRRGISGPIGAVLAWHMVAFRGGWVGAPGRRLVASALQAYLSHEPSLCCSMCRQTTGLVLGSCSCWCSARYTLLSHMLHVVLYMLYLLLCVCAPSKATQQRT